ncbi:zf-UBP-domain-containing protein, partial [Coemansia reversa NRRL 1564]
LAVLAVPGYMTPTDFLSFTGPFSDSIEHVRVIRDSSPNHYMILLKFRSLAKADEFYAYYNGKTFSPLEPETCHVVYISEVQCETWEVRSEDIDKENQLTELPTCPVCLERLDSAVSGLLTTLCQHIFHCRCLARWGDGNCPVCRYSQTSAFGIRMSGTSAMESGKAPEDGNTSEQSRCHICERTNDLWICLICGTIGCGRYANGHAKDHFGQTQHPYSMELESQSVWDYAGDGYVHRLMQNMADRKVIALDTQAIRRNARSMWQRAPPSRGSFMDAREKLDAVTQEYEMLLVSQLESQREHYEMQLARMHHQQAQQIKKYAELERKYEDHKSEHLAALETKLKLNEEEHKEWMAERKRLETNANKWLKKSTDDAKRLMEEKAIAKQFADNQTALNKRIAELEANSVDLQEQIRDLTFFISTQKSLAAEQNADSELHGASV